MTDRAQARSTFTVDFAQKRPLRATVAPTGRVPRVARMLALAHKVEAMVRDGEFRNYADAARRLGLTRARVTQITNLLLLAPTIQEAILDLPPVTTGRDPISERQLRPIVAEPDWDAQMSMWTKLSDTPPRTGSRRMSRCTPGCHSWWGPKCP